MRARVRFAATSAVACFLAACAASHPAPAGGAPPAPPRADIQQAYGDTSEQAKIGRFFQAYRTRSLPFQRDGNYLGEIVLLRSLEDSLGPSPAIHSLVAQQVATYLSFLGRPREAFALFDSLSDEPPDTAAGDRLLTYGVEDAAAAIARIADTARIIMVNEAHHVPQGRALTLALLKPLYDRGYTYFAAETFGETDSAMNRRGWPVHTTGFYSNEPLFGEVIRAALRLGYTLVPYEALNAAGQDARERGEAEHLRDRIFRDHPDAKVLVHAGYDHINESGTLGGALTMAQRFRELTGIDPVTVDQTTMVEHGDSLHERRAYRDLVRAHPTDRPFVLRRPDGTLWSGRPGVRDVTVIAPRTTWRLGRPDWLWWAGDRRALPVPDDACGQAPRCVVAARRSRESDDAVPVDQLLVDAGVPSPPLLLPAGDYTITATGAGGEPLGRRTVTVP